MSTTEDVNWDDVGYVRASQYRQTVVNHLADTPATPSDIDEETGFDIAHISRALQNLRDRDLVELLVDEDTQKGRYYGLTSDGETVREQLVEVTT